MEPIGSDPRTEVRTTRGKDRGGCGDIIRGAGRGRQIFVGSGRRGAIGRRCGARRRDGDRLGLEGDIFFLERVEIGKLRAGRGGPVFPRHHADLESLGAAKTDGIVAVERFLRCVRAPAVSAGQSRRSHRIEVAPALDREGESDRIARGGLLRIGGGFERELTDGAREIFRPAFLGQRLDVEFAFVGSRLDILRASDPGHGEILEKLIEERIEPGRTARRNHAAFHLRGRNLERSALRRGDRAAEGDDIVGDVIEVLLGLLGLAQWRSGESVAAEGRTLQVVELAVGAEIEAQFDGHHFADVGGLFLAHNNLAVIRRGLAGAGAGRGAGGGLSGRRYLARRALLRRLLLRHRRSGNLSLHAGARRRRHAAARTGHAQAHRLGPDLTSVDLHGKTRNGEIARTIRHDGISEDEHRGGLQVDHLHAA